jgi:trigger factor
MAEEQQTTGLKNTVTIEGAGPCKKRVSVEIPQETIKKATDEQYETLRKEALVPGFRKGRVPRRLLEKRFGKETSEQIKLKLLADASDSAIKDNKLDTLREPNIDFEKVELPDNGPLKFDFEVEVRPEFELPQLNGIAVERKRLEITDEQIDREIEQMRKYAGLWSPRREGEAVELDDQVIADVVLKVEGAEQEQKLDNVEIHVRQNGFVGAIAVEKLDELLVGAKAEDTKKIMVEVPKTYFREEYRGKKVDIEIAVKDIKWLKSAELNEDFFKRFGVENESQLREKLRDGLRSRLEQQVQADMAEQIYKYMLDNTSFDLPTNIVAEQSETLLRRQYINLLQRGLTREQIEEHMEQLRTSSDKQAAEQLKTFFIMDKVADKLGVEVSEEEINGYIAQLAVQRGQRPERMREQMMRDGSLAQLRLQVRENKCIAKLLESAKITEVEPEKKPKKAAAKAVPSGTAKSIKKAAVVGKKPPKKGKTAAKKKTGK